MLESYSANLPLILTALMLVAVLYLFVREVIPAHLTAMSVMALLLATGIISVKDALSVFSNAAPITIAGMCILSAALEQTGVIDALGQRIIRFAQLHKALAVGTLLFGVMGLSAFINNTPLVIMMTPVVIALAKSFGDSPSRYLIPLSYSAILGGTCALIGTSTNIVVDGMARQYGQPAFTMFEISGAGVIMAATGGLFMLLFARRLLPDRPPLDRGIAEEAAKRKRFTAEALVPHYSPLVGKTLNEMQLGRSARYEIIDLVRNDQGRWGGFRGMFHRMREVADRSVAAANNSPRSAIHDVPIQAGDRLVFKANKEELLEIRSHLGITFRTDDTPLAELLTTRETEMQEGFINANSSFIGQKPSELNLRRRYGCYILAIFRDAHNITGNVEQVALREGDILLIEGAKDDLKRLFEQEHLQNLSKVSTRPWHPKKAPLAIAVLTGVVSLAAFNVMDIAGLAIIGAMLVILTGCIAQEKAYEAVEWRILMLIFGMLSLAIAMDNTGLARMVVEGMASFADHLQLGPVGVLAAVYLIAMVTTEIMSNNAVAALLTPIVIALAGTMGIDPRPLIVAVMFGASASFATPIGYQTNTFVYNVGNYRFKDFLRVGLPMNLLMMAVAVTVIPLFWDF